MNDLATFDLDQFLGPAAATAQLSPYQDGAMFPASPAASDAALWSPDDQLFAQMMAATPLTAEHDAFPASVDVTGLDAFFAGSDFGGECFDEVSVLQDLETAALMGNASPSTSTANSSPQFETMLQPDQAWATSADTLLFPDLFSPHSAPRPVANKVELAKRKPAVVKSRSPRLIAPAVKPQTVVPLPANFPLLATIGPTAASLALNPAALAAASAATGVEVQALQQQLQAFATMQARQAPAPVVAPVPAPVVAPAAAAPALVAPGRKRKVRHADVEAVYAELDAKRQRNTEAARRSRERKANVTKELEVKVADLEDERDVLGVQVQQLTAERVEFLAEIAALQQRLALYES
ncbi:hypothetical protein HKX48_001453 [Thoreauomyces humboldtii]|nr:hypothetical protein HKX48_001453 [Thoreauomyces humboldtii]